MIDILLDILLSSVSSNLFDYLTFWVLAFTLIVVTVYTVFTKQQTDELIKQRRLSIMPSLTCPGDRATLGSDPSTVAGANTDGPCLEHGLSFGPSGWLLSAKPRGVGGRAPI